MAKRYQKAPTKSNRRFGMAIFPANKAFERKPYFPGQHGPRMRMRKQTEYSVGLLEKQKLKFSRLLLEKQFRKIFAEARRLPGVTGENFLRLLDTRLDNVVYLMGFARTRKASRQFVAHGHIRVNGRRVNIASFQCSAGDVIEVSPRPSARQLATRSLDGAQYRVNPAWITVETDALKATVNRLPSAEELEDTINVQLIVEFYSR